MEFEVTHKTTYTYTQPVGLCHNLLKLWPRDTANQQLQDCVVTISPTPDVTTEFTDFFGNKVIYFAVQRVHRQLTVTVFSKILLNPSNKQYIAVGEANWLSEKKELMALIKNDASILQYTLVTHATQTNKEIEEFAQKCFSPTSSILEGCTILMESIFKEFEFKPGFTTISTPLSVVMSERKGVCQDFAHLGVSCLRSIGLPARYVSGYIETLPPKGKEKLVGVDASHAWFSAYIPQLGWVDFDPTNNMIPSDRHITVGWGRDYFDISPMKGIIQNSGTHALNVSVDVRRVNIEPKTEKEVAVQHKSY